MPSSWHFGGAAEAVGDTGWRTAILPMRIEDVPTAGAEAGIRHSGSIAVVDGVVLVQPHINVIVDETATSQVSGVYVREPGFTDTAVGFSVVGTLGIRGGGIDGQQVATALCAVQMIGATPRGSDDRFVAARLVDTVAGRFVSLLSSIGGWSDADVAIANAAPVPHGPVTVALHRAGDSLGTVTAYLVNSDASLVRIGAMSGWSPTAPVRFIHRGLTDTGGVLCTLADRSLTGVAVDATTMTLVESNATRIAFLGDSTVANTGVGKAGRLESLLSDLGTIVMLAENGDRIRDYLAEGRIGELASARPDIVCVQFGINDADVGIYAGSTEERQALYQADLLALISLIRRRTGARVMLANGMYWDPADPLRTAGNENGPNVKVAPFWAVSLDVATAMGLPYADVATAMAAGAGGPSMLVDSIHPNAIGVAYMATAWRAVLEAV